MCPWNLKWKCQRKMYFGCQSFLKDCHSLEGSYHHWLCMSTILDVVDLTYWSLQGPFHSLSPHGFRILTIGILPLTLGVWISTWNTVMKFTTKKLDRQKYWKKFRIEILKYWFKERMIQFRKLNLGIFFKVCENWFQFLLRISIIHINIKLLRKLLKLKIDHAKYLNV